MNLKLNLLFTAVLLLALKGYSQMVGSWDNAILKQVPSWRETTLALEDGITSLLYETLDYMGNPVEVFAYYSALDRQIPEGS